MWMKQKDVLQLAELRRSVFRGEGAACVGVKPAVTISPQHTAGSLETEIPQHP